MSTSKKKKPNRRGGIHHSKKIKDNRILVKKCPFSGKHPTKCLVDFNQLVEKFKTLFWHKETKEELNQCLWANIPQNFEARFYGDCVMSMLSNVTSETISILFDNKSQMQRFIYMMMILFAENFETECDNKKHYWSAFPVAEAEAPVKYCPCSYQYLFEYGDPFHTETCRIKTKEGMLKLHVNWKPFQQYFVQHQSNATLHFEEADITWHPVDGFVLLEDATAKFDSEEKSQENTKQKTIESVKQNIINKKLTLKRERRQQSTSERIEMYYTTIARGYTINEPLPWRIDMLFTIDIQAFTNICHDIISITALITIIHEYATLTRDSFCAFCDNRMNDVPCAVTNYCQCFATRYPLQNNNICHIRCLRIFSGGRSVICSTCYCSIAFARENQ